MARNPPSASISVTVASSTSEMQSHRTLPAGVQTRSARWPMAKAGSSADADDARLVLAEYIGMRRLQRRQCRPALAGGRNILALLLADRTVLRRRRGWRECGSASCADERRHRF